VGKITLETLKFTNTCLDLAAMPLDQIDHVMTWGCTTVAYGDDVSDLGEG
jgi:hypothetical protein